MYSKENLGSLLVRAGVITPADLQKALAVVDAENRRLGEVLVEKGLTTEEQIQHFVGIQLGYPTLRLDRTYIDLEVARLLPQKFSQRYGVLPLYRTETGTGPVIVVAMTDPTNIMIQDEVRKALGEDIFVTLVSLGDMNRSLERIWKEEVPSPPPVVEQGAVQLPLSVDGETKPSVAKILETLFNQALDLRVDAIHLEPKQKYAAIRYKIDGGYVSITSLPRETYQAVLTRIKILAKLTIAESVLDVAEGRFHLRPDLSRPFIDVRVTVVPSVFGEKAILKMTRREDIIRPADQLGFEPAQLPVLQALLARPSGLVLVSGKNDSGKTTLAYSLLAAVGTPNNMIVTVEDPPAYPVSSFNQVKKVMNEKGGEMSWEQTLKAVERQEPDIVFLSHVDTLEEARMMQRFAATGRRVLGTLYAEDATSSHWVPLQLGGDAHAIAWALSGVIACRLVRLLCPACRREAPPADEQLALLGIKRERLPQGRYCVPAGCESCSGTGYRGRTGVYEIMPVPDHVREMIASRQPSDAVRSAVIEAGMMTLREAGLAKAARGITSLAEVCAIL